MKLSHIFELCVILTDISILMKFDKIYKVVAFLLLATFLLGDTSFGQKIIETPKTSKKKKHLDTECNLSDYERQYIFTKVENLATFRGFSPEWFKYAQNNFDFTLVSQKLVDTTQIFHDSIFLKFIVTKAGLICKIEVLKGNQILAAPAIKLIKQSSPWIPAVSGGRNLNAYRTLKIEVVVDKQKNEFKIVRDFNSYMNPDG